MEKVRKTALPSGNKPCKERKGRKHGSVESKEYPYVSAILSVLPPEIELEGNQGSKRCDRRSEPADVRSDENPFEAVSER